MSLAELLHLAIAAALVAAAWLVPRHIAGARWSRPIALLLDSAPILLGGGLLAVAAGRPLFAGVVVLALAVGFGLADYTMRQTLREPTVFSEAVELPQVFTHPHLYLPFAGPGLVLGGATAGVLTALALLVAEPPLWEPKPILALAAMLLAGGGAWLLSRGLPLASLAEILRRHAQPCGEPFEDAATLGPFGMLIVHAVIARAERGARQRDLAAPWPVRRLGEQTGPIVVVQCESFFDARRLSPQIPGEFLASFDRCCATASQHGRLAVPGWGANTMRAEFAVLTGIPESKLGYDRFNPYYALARVPLESHMWRLRRAGYRTICLHPFDRRFFRRDLAMPALGFEQFLGRETIGGSRTPPYYPDPELAAEILRIIDREGPDTLVFAITMGNHGPWLLKGPPVDPAVASRFDAAGIPDGAGLLRYLDGLKRSDEMLQLLMAGLEQRGLPATLAFYGDHLPSLSGAFAHFGFDEGSSDYVIWTTGNTRTDDGPRRQDIAAHELGGAVIDAAARIARLPEAPFGSACLAAPEPARFAG